MGNTKTDLTQETGFFGNNNFNHLEGANHSLWMHNLEDNSHTEELWQWKYQESEMFFPPDSNTAPIHVNGAAREPHYPSQAADPDPINQEN